MYIYICILTMCVQVHTPNDLAACTYMYMCAEHMIFHVCVHVCVCVASINQYTLQAQEDLFLANGYQGVL